ncbi:MAG: transcriptional activator NhaR [Planctomycetaceae bacterium]
MNWFNYHHFYYFWMAARLGSISAAADKLNLSRPTISAQLKQLEESLGKSLFDRSSRSIKLSEFGQIAFSYAEDIFTSGQEFQDLVAGNLSSKPSRFRVGTPDAMPKLITYRLLKPTLNLATELQMSCVEGKLDDLLAELAVHRLDLVLSDSPVSAAMNVKAYNHLLGESGVSFFATSSVVEQQQKFFPDCLSYLPLLQPIETTSLRRSLNQWFGRLGIQPKTRAEFQDSALMKVFGQAGEGVFPAPTAIENDVCDQYNVKVLGRTIDIRECFYAISVERRIKHPAVLAVSESARNLLLH